MGVHYRSGNFPFLVCNCVVPKHVTNLWGQPHEVNWEVGEWKCIVHNQPMRQHYSIPCGPAGSIEVGNSYFTWGIKCFVDEWVKILWLYTYVLCLINCWLPFWEEAGVFSGWFLGPCYMIMFFTSDFSCIFVNDEMIGSKEMVLRTGKWYISLCEWLALL